jgi:hypothetical protein
MTIAWVEQDLMLAQQAAEGWQARTRSNVVQQGQAWEPWDHRRRHHKHKAGCSHTRQGQGSGQVGQQAAL